MKASEYYIVSLSDNAFFTVVSAALEAFNVPHEKSGSPHEGSDSYEAHIDMLEQDDYGVDFHPVETYGNLWGYTSYTDLGEEVVRIEYADVDTSAERTSDCVVADDQARKLKSQLLHELKPEYRYLGDFHSHPYTERQGVTSSAVIEKEKLYHFSKQDFVSSRQLVKNEIGYQVGLVVTIYRTDGKKSRLRNSRVDGDSGIRFCYEDFVVWIKAYVFYESLHKVMRVKDSKVGLVCPSIGYSVVDLNT